MTPKVSRANLESDHVVPAATEKETETHFLRTKSHIENKYSRFWVFLQPLRQNLMVFIWAHNNKSELLL